MKVLEAGKALCDIKVSPMALHPCPVPFELLYYIPFDQIKKNEWRECIWLHKKVKQIIEQ